MKRKFLLMVLLGSISQANYAQQSAIHLGSAEPLSFSIDLGAGNKLAVEASSRSALRYIGDADSLLKKVSASIAWLKASAQTKLMVTRLEYISSADGQDRISIKQYPAIEKNYIMQNGEAYPLKTAQDTLVISGSYPPGPATNTVEIIESWSLNFILNNTWEMEQYINTGLPAKLHAVEKAPAPSWIKTKTGLLYLRTDPTVVVKTNERLENRERYISPFIAVGVQNYRNSFLPSFVEGIIYTDISYSINHTYGIYAEQLFGFEKDSEGKFKSQLNHIISISYDQHDLTTKKEIFLPIHFSLGYLWKGNGDTFENKTFRLGAGKVTALKGKTMIEPLIYFNSFFKDVSPGIRLVQKF